MAITYVKLESQYPEDFTKHAPLTPLEADMNINTLEGRDIKSVSVDDGKLSIKLYNGDMLVATIGKSDSDKVSDVVFDKPNGILTLVFADGATKSIEGFATKSNTGVTVATDGTLKGNGLPANPIGLSPVSKTGWYRPVERIIHTCDGEKLPEGKHVAIGERYLTVEKISDYGFLYNYESLRKIACDLRAENSPWRVPTKADWDDMLNAVEPCIDDQNHELASGNRYLGRLAGKFLKSRNLWLGSKFSGALEEADEGPQNYVEYDDFNCGCDHKDKGEPKDKTFCRPPVCGEHGHPHHHPKPLPAGGLDKYGFHVTPAGYIDDGGNFLFFKERASFWTATNLKMSTVYVKRFEYDHDNVHQDIVPAQMRLSIRLVKDYDGSNYNEREDILGQSYSTILMPSMKDGSKIWTSANIALSDPKYRPSIPNDGQGLTFTKHFFINEWNGKEWVRNEMRDGESVIVKISSDGSLNAEYRVIENEIANVSLSIIKTVAHGVKHQIGHIEDKLDHEIRRSVNVDKAHSESITELQDKINEIENQTGEIAGIKETLEQAVEGINTNKDEIKKVSDKLDEEIERIDGAMADEAKAREEADKEIKKNLEDVKTDVENLQKDVEDAAKDMDQLQEDLEKKIEEIQKSNSETDKKVEELEAKLPVQEGSEYDPTTGELTLKSQGGENDIKVKFVFDFGQF